MQLAELFRGWLTVYVYMEKWTEISQMSQTWHCLGKKEASFILAAAERSEFPFAAKVAAL